MCYTNLSNKDSNAKGLRRHSTPAMAQRLVGLDWKFGVTSSSDELQAVGSSFVVVRLTTAPKEGDGEERVLCMELTLPQFYSFLHQLETAKATLDNA